MVCHFDLPLPPVTDLSRDELQEDLSCIWDEDQVIVHGATALAVEGEEYPVPDDRDPGIQTLREEYLEDVKVHSGLSRSQTAALEDLLQEFTDLFMDLPGVTSVLHHRVQLTYTTPFRHSYPMPHHLQGQLKQDLDRWLELGIVEPSNSPWCSPLLAVRKKDGTHRFCLDCRRLNAQTTFDAEPLHDPEYILTQLSGTRYLSKMDLASGFWQNELEDDTKPLTAFSTRQGLFQFCVMPFGMVNAPGVFSRLMRTVIRDVSGVTCFMDDILVANAEWEDHLTTLHTVFQHLRESELHLKPSRWEMAFPHLDYLGHHIGEGETRPLRDRAEDLCAIPKRRTLRELKSFLGSLGYYQRFIPGFNQRAVPLFDLQKGLKAHGSALQWTDEADLAFVDLRGALCNEPVLQLIDPSLGFVLQTDASDEGLGAVLLQARCVDPQDLTPVQFLSRRLRPAERNYSVVEREALAVYWAVKKFERYLYGCEFTLRTDHQPLLHLQHTDK